MFYPIFAIVEALVVTQKFFDVIVIISGSYMVSVTMFNLCMKNV